jgi:integrase
MQGSVRQRGRGVWEVRVYLGRDERTGQKRYRSRTVRGSRRDADQVCRDLVESSESERDAPGPEELPTVGEWIDEWWPEKKKAISPTTASSWQSVIDIYVRPRLGEMPLHEVRARHLESL